MSGADGNNNNNNDNNNKVKLRDVVSVRWRSGDDQRLGNERVHRIRTEWSVVAEQRGLDRTKRPQPRAALAVGTRLETAISLPSIKC